MASKYGSFFTVAVASGIAVPACSGGSSDGSGGRVDAGTDSPTTVVPPDAGRDTSVPDTSMPMPDVNVPDTSVPDTSMPATDAGPDVVDAASEAASCQPLSGDVSDPSIVSAAVIGSDQVGITFSEPVKPPQGVDPTKFRLSLGHSSTAEGTYTYYEDLGYYFGSPGAYAFTALSGSCTDSLVATINATIDIGALCAAIDTISMNFGATGAGLYLHFREADTPTIVDRADNTAGDVSPAWTVQDDAGALADQRREDGVFPNGAIAIAINCPTDAGDSGSGDAATD